MRPMTRYEQDVLDAKLALEEEVATPLMKACAAYLADWALRHGRVSMFQKVTHQQVLEAVLCRHYARVVMVMTGRAPGPDARIETAMLSMGHGETLRARAHHQALMILAGMDRDLARAELEIDAGQDARTAKQFDGEIEVKLRFSVEYISKWKEAAKAVVDKVKNRITAIANTQTQEPAEEARYEWVKQREATGRIEHEWNCKMDGRERDWHHDAHQQVRPVDVPFDVGGEQLRFPGDGTLGASLRNLVNCRCWTVAYAVGPNGERERMDWDLPSIPAKRTWRQGDRLGQETPVTPTTSVTLNGNTRARIVLGDGSFATMRQMTPSTITISNGRRQIARATSSNGEITSMTVDPAFAGRGVEELLRRSVAESFARRRP